MLQIKQLIACWYNRRGVNVVSESEVFLWLLYYVVVVLEEIIRKGIE